MTKKANVGLFNFYKKEGLRGKSWGLGWQRRIDELLRFSTGNFFLDVGCAEGLFVQLISEQKQMEYVVGLEISRPKLILAKRNVRRKGTDFVNASWDFLPFREKKFDTVIWFDGLEHSPNPNLSLREIGRTTKKNLIISVPTSTPLLLLVEHLQTKLNRFMLNILGKPFRGHLHAYTFADIQKLLDLEDFRTVHRSHNIPLLPFWKRIKLLFFAVRQIITKTEPEPWIFNSIFVLKPLRQRQ